MKVLINVVLILALNNKVKPSFNSNPLIVELIVHYIVLMFPYITHYVGYLSMSCVLLCIAVSMNI